MKKYTRPNLEITSFDVRDIITVSGEIVNGSQLTGKDASIYEVYRQNSAAPVENVSVFTW